jgi:hypothetical protein
MERLGAPRSGRGSRPRLNRWTESGRDQPNIRPLISPYDLNLTYFILFLFHHRLVHRMCLIITINAIRLTATIQLSF